ncbi:hypothetical protein [Ottowia sp.]|uniref:hypothetical protein n=1 Tax=Ottowia sp. TaxID=1898956 RepID=UPI0026361CD3|nr:hypothetical protein [Ottowia sp.]
MEPIDKPAPVRRADPRAALAWIGERPGRVALVVLLLAGSTRHGGLRGGASGRR